MLKRFDVYAHPEHIGWLPSTANVSSTTGFWHRFGGKQFLEVSFAVCFALALKEWCTGHWFLAWSAANKVILMPWFVQRFHYFTYDGFTALCTCFRVFLGVAFWAHWISFAFIECNGSNWFFAHLANKMFWMPGFAQSSQSLSLNWVLAFTTDCLRHFSKSIFLYFTHWIENGKIVV